ncbi:DUF421 domain-containing protein [Filobacillus milosensis]|uniref:DUF421 domain-containing protein n=1 Tax=Filobacillus milosensis TaxID=94137 RepID=A0A4Y8IRB2_9BACI|nr:DUF421 domain-containing protein [Filobacillus milosensis]TFB24323.1 DUF421 domain-containing protein [Filobacillus milosensis]
MNISELVIRLAIAFITLLTLTRMMGRKEISQMTFFNFVSGISIGTLGATLAIDSSLSVSHGILALVIWSLFTILIGYIDLKSKKIRYVVEGQPRILIKKGKIMENELKRVRLDIDALLNLLRKKNVFAISDVDYAIFETDGSLSVMKKESKQPLIKQDMNIPNTKDVFPISTTVISDGKIVNKVLDKLNVDRTWIDTQLKSLGINSVSEVFYAEVQKDGSLYIDRRDDT